MSPGIAGRGLVRRRKSIAIAQVIRRILSVRQGETKMLWTIFVILLVLWALGMVTAYTMGGLIHLLLVVALVVMIFRLMQGRSAV
jgi:hypothetical protein